MPVCIAPWENSNHSLKTSTERAVSAVRRQGSSLSFSSSPPSAASRRPHAQPVVQLSALIPCLPASVGALHALLQIAQDVPVADRQSLLRQWPFSGSFCLKVYGAVKKGLPPLFCGQKTQGTAATPSSPRLPRAIYLQTTRLWAPGQAAALRGPACRNLHSIGTSRCTPPASGQCDGLSVWVLAI